MLQLLLEYTNIYEAKANMKGNFKMLLISIFVTCTTFDAVCTSESLFIEMQDLQQLKWFYYLNARCELLVSEPPRPPHVCSNTCTICTFLDIKSK